MSAGREWALRATEPPEVGRYGDRPAHRLAMAEREGLSLNAMQSTGSPMDSKPPR